MQYTLHTREKPCGIGGKKKSAALELVYSLSRRCTYIYMYIYTHVYILLRSFFFILFWCCCEGDRVPERIICRYTKKKKKNEGARKTRLMSRRFSFPVFASRCAAASMVIDATHCYIYIHTPSTRELCFGNGMKVKFYTAFVYMYNCEVAFYIGENNVYIASPWIIHCNVAWCAWDCKLFIDMREKHFSKHSRVCGLKSLSFWHANNLVHNVNSVNNISSLTTSLIIQTCYIFSSLSLSLSRLRIITPVEKALVYASRSLSIYTRQVSN